MAKLEQNKAFQGLLQLFAGLFTFPERNFHEELTSGKLDQQIRELSSAAGMPIMTDFQGIAGNYEAMVDTFNRCFLGIRRPYAPLVESVYKVWTSDQSYQVPHKNQKGFLMGDSALHVKHIIAYFGLEIPKEYEMIPDHLTVLLEVYAFLIGQGLIAEAEQFKKDHLDWLPDFAEQLSGIEDSGVYRYTTSKLMEILDTYC